MANQALKKLNYQIGRICRMGSRKLKLMAVNNRRKQQLRHLGERIYILKTLQQDDNIWDKDEISQLLLTIADLDQEIEMLIEEINEIKAEDPPEDVAGPIQAETPAAETPTAETEAPEAAPRTEEKKAAAAATADEKKPTPKAAAKKTEKKPAGKPAAAKSAGAKSEPAKAAAAKSTPKRKAAGKSAAKSGPKKESK